MGWRERDYSRVQWTEPGAGGSWFRWPARGAGILIGLHVAAFVLLQVIASEGGGEIVAALALSGGQASPAGIGLHPWATRDALSLIITVAVIWILGGAIERQRGAGRMVGLYVVGNVLAGVVFFVVARLLPGWATVELDYPAGAFAAWCVAAFRMMGGESMLLLGRVRRVSHVVGIGLAVVVGLMLAFRGLGAIGWFLALAAGAGGEPVLAYVGALFKRDVSARPRRAVRPSIPREARPADEPNIDDILAKISEQGLDSLTQEERERLEAARRAKLQASQDLNSVP